MFSRSSSSHILFAALLLVPTATIHAATGPAAGTPATYYRTPAPPPTLGAPSAEPTGVDGPPSDGRWHPFGLLQIENHAALYDAARDRLISLGGDPGGSGTFATRPGSWELPLTGTVAWRELVTRPGQPWPVGWWASQYDPTTGDLYFQAVGPSYTVVICRMDPATGAFEPIQATGAPTYPYVPYMTMAFDPARQRFFLFGGQNDDFRLPDDLWVLDLEPAPHWSKWAPGGPSPQGRIGAALVLDPERNRLLMLGGLANVSPGVWALSLDTIPTWSLLSTIALPGDANWNGMVLDRTADRILAFHAGGETWAFSLRTHEWTVLAISGPRPPGRKLVPLVLDRERHRLMIAGGRSEDETDLLNDAWALSLDGTPRWTPLVSGIVRPPIRFAASAAFDAARRRMVVFGGANDFGRLNDTWALDLEATRWSEVVAQGISPIGRYWHASAYDPVRDQLVVFGGYPSPEGYDMAFSDLWTMSFAGDVPVWTKHEASDPSPPARALSTLTFDPPHDRFILMYGYGFGGSTALADIWELRFTPDAVWRPMSPVGSPPPRFGAMATYDPARNRILLFGGDSMDGPLNDTWAFDLGSPEGMWYPLTSTTRPAPRGLGLFHLDAARDRAVLFGGGADIAFMNDAWELPLDGASAWRRLSPTGAAPRHRYGMIGAYDPVFDRLLVFGGGAWQAPFNDTWALEFGEPVAPIQLELASVESAPDRVRLVWTCDRPGLSTRLERMAEDGPWQALGVLTADAQGRIEHEDRDVRPGMGLQYRLVVVQNGEERRLGLAGVTLPVWSFALAIASPSAGVAFRLRLDSAAPATLAAYDVAGRRVWRREVGVLGPGDHEIHATEVPWRAGIYYARLDQTGRARTVRFVVLR